MPPSGEIVTRPWRASQVGRVCWREGDSVGRVYGGGGGGGQRWGGCPRSKA